MPLPQHHEDAENEGDLPEIPKDLRCNFCVRQESLFENNDQSVTNKFKEEVQHHRKFTAMVIEQIKDWKNYLLSIREGVF